MAVTQYGAVMENNTPSPWEVQKFYDQEKLQQIELGIKQKQAELAAKKLAMDRHKEMTKPLDEYKINTGVLGNDLIHPDEVVGKELKARQDKLAEMYKSGASEYEANQFVAQSVRELDAIQNRYKNMNTEKNAQLATITEADGIDKNAVNRLLTTEMLERVKSGKGSEFLLPEVLKKYAEGLYVNNAQKLYEFPFNNEHRQEYDQVRGSDGRLLKADVTVPYNDLFQTVKMLPDKTVKVVTKSEPATINGQTVNVMPNEVFVPFISNPGRLVMLEQGVKEELEGIKAQNLWDANKQAGQMLNQQYGPALQKLPAATRLSMQRKLTNEILSAIPEPDRDLITRKVAYDQADRLIPKKEAQVNPIRIPATHITNNMGITVPYIDAYKKIVEAAGPDGYVPTNKIPYPIKKYVLDDLNGSVDNTGNKIWEQSLREGDIQFKAESGVVNIYHKDGRLLGPLDKEFINTHFNSAKGDNAAITDAQKTPLPTNAIKMKASDFRKLSITERKKFLDNGGIIEK